MQAASSAGRPSAIRRAAYSVNWRRRFVPRFRVGKPETDRLKVDDRAAERLAVAGVADSVAERRARHADALRGDADAAAFQGGEGNPVALAFRADALVFRHLHVLSEVRAQVSEAFWPTFSSIRVTAKPGWFFSITN